MGNHVDPASIAALKWRCIGPSRAGRVVAVAGDANDRMTFYFGACAGGIWKTTDGGNHWRNVSDGFLTSSSVGAIAVARSDSNIVYAGMGETTIRLDVSYGDGVYKSDDAGRTWRNVGLKNSKHIGRVTIHPTNPDIVYVAALGDIFGPNEERGVFRTTDGGQTWKNILYRDADSGAVDLSMDPNNPRTLFATIWQTRRNFWNISSGGPGSGLFRSHDGGDTWEEITRAPGLPQTGLIGKIGVAVSPARAGRVWALVEAEGEATGLYRSENWGASWKQVCASRDLMHRPWYYTHVFADTTDGDTVHVTNLAYWKSTDGGATFTEINTSHGDNHDLWIDPNDSNRMIEGHDGGAGCSFNGGLTWSSTYNQLTAQFYRIDTDNRFPYRVYGTQQDNTSIAVPSMSVWGAIPLGDATYPGTGESGFIAVHPKDDNIVYCGAVGSSPGGAGALQRWDARHGQIQLVNVWPEESTGVAPKDMTYRFAWTFPITFSPHDSNILYAAGNCVWRTMDEGMSWERISPDLSLNDKTRQDHSGGPITRESAGAEVHATCASLQESPHRKGEIWASTDDGLVHVTRDNGASWTNVTPPDMPPLAYVGCVEISAHDADTVYVSATRYKLSDYKPYLFRTKDGGKSWASITGDFPTDEITRVIRSDSERAGLLFVGTETGVFFSLDDGAHWGRMAGGIPNAPVYDLKIKNADLVAGTHGRSFWILDDITPLRQLADGNRASRLLAPRTVVRHKPHHAAMWGVKPPISFGLTFGIGGAIATNELPDGTKVREHIDVGENPPYGALIHYWLADGAGPVSLAIRDGQGNEIVRFASDDTNLPAAKRPTTKPGLNRFVWDLRHPAPTKLDTSLAPPKPKSLSGDGDGPTGPLAVPGNYVAALTVGGSTQESGFTVVKDPRLPTTQAAYEAQFALLRELTDCLGTTHAAINRIRRAKKQIDAAAAAHPNLKASADAAREKLSAVEGKLIDVHRHSPRDALRNPAGLVDTLADCISMANNADFAPTKQTAAVSRETMDKVAAQLALLDAAMAGEVAALNKEASGLAHVTG